MNLETITKDTQISELIKTKEWRLALWRSSVMLFAMIYFPHYFTTKMPDFHKDLYRLLQFVWENPDIPTESFYNHLLIIGFRDSAKTSLAKIEMIRNIVFWLRKVMFYVSYEENAARDNLFDVALELQTNERILADFWQLYFEDDSSKNQKSKKKSKKSSISNFLTANWVKVQASSVAKSLRWKNFWWSRIDFIILDDFEVSKTVKSAALTKQVINYINELVPWTTSDCKIIYLWNKISDSWSVQYLIDRFEWNPNARIFEKSLIENWQITWPDKFVMTDEEATKVNSELAKSWTKHKVKSIESLKRTLNKNWKAIFEQEYLNLPMTDWDRLFNIDMVDKWIEHAWTYNFEEDWRWKIWDWPEYSHTYVIWVDISEWLWIDSSVIQVLDMTTWEQVAEYEYNYSDPNMLTEEIIQASNNYNNCLIIPERNAVWNAVISLLREKWYANRMPLERVFDTNKFKKINKYWFHTNSKTKPKIIFDLKDAFENWYLIIKSKALLREMRSFSNLDVSHSNFDEDASNHFDRVMSIAIAWTWRDRIQVKWRSSLVDNWIIKRKWLSIRRPWQKEHKNIIDIF